uniref:Uncharacterized protein n=1 Tax=Cannabis sativa TaxID=3483 RepID=A0A803P449_CANSA
MLTFGFRLRTGCVFYRKLKTAMIGLGQFFNLLSILYDACNDGSHPLGSEISFELLTSKCRIPLRANRNVCFVWNLCFSVTYTAPETLIMTSLLQLVSSFVYLFKSFGGCLEWYTMSVPNKVELSETAGSSSSARKRQKLVREKEANKTLKRASRVEEATNLSANGRDVGSLQDRTSGGDACSASSGADCRGRGSRESIGLKRGCFHAGSQCKAASRWEWATVEVGVLVTELERVKASNRDLGADNETLWVELTDTKF